MRSFDSWSRRTAAAGVAIALAACSDAVPNATGPADGRVTPDVAPAAATAVTSPAFTWLAPLGTGVAAPATFDAGAAPVVEVCAWTGAACAGAPVARFSTAPAAGDGTLTPNAAAGQYEANWNLLNSAFTTRRTYRIRVLRGAAEVGSTSVDVVRGRWALTQNDGTLAPLAAASALPIRFHLARETLRLYAGARGLRVGAAVAYTGTTFPTNASYVGTLTREFNLVAPENIMKWSVLRRDGRTSWRFQFGDQLLDSAAAHGMVARGHTLAWYSNNPAWLDALTPATTPRDTGIAILQEHISTVLTHWQGRIREWDVVNEAIADDGTGRRPASASVWERIIGRDWIDIAFRTARAADPNALLFYNDYNIEYPGRKQDSVFALVRDLKARGVPVDGVGFQSHFTSGSVPSAAVLKASVDRFAALGLRVSFTELDVGVTAPVTDAKRAAQAAEFRWVVQTCMEHPACGTVVVWAVDDADSWRAANVPVLFDGTFAPKPAYASVLDYLAGR